MHRWKLINDALSLGKPEPEETYSTSEHLYAELDIPREATGTLPRAQRGREGLEAEAMEDIGETGKVRSRSRSRGSSARGARPARRRRRTRGGTPLAAAGTEGGPAAVTQDGAAGEPAHSRSRRRRRTRGGHDLAGPASGANGAGSAGGPEATERKAS